MARKPAPPAQHKAAPRKPGRHPRPATSPALPGKAAILQAMASQPGLTGKRDLSRHFAIKGDMRAPFKVLLREMETEGMLGRTRKTLRPAGELPAVTVLDIPANADPEDLIGFPAQWDQDTVKPGVGIRPGPRGRAAPGPGDRILARITRGQGQDPAYSAKVMKILPKPHRAQIGVVRLDADGARLVPVERKGREMRIAASDLGKAGDGDLVEVEVRPSGRLMVPKARVTAVVGNPHSEGAISLIALHGLEIPYRFPPGVIRAAAAAKQANLKGREDWRNIPFVTIDPAGAKDHDDAVFAEPDSDPANPGGHIVRVAIADVAAYVRSDGVLDREAYLRGNSVYFPDRVVPMLPERISNDLCSLKPGVNRPALALAMVLDARGVRKHHSFHRVLIRSAAKLSYPEAQAAIDGRPGETAKPLLETVLQPLWAAYHAMARARDHRAPLDLDLPERRIELDENGSVIRIHVPERLEAHRLIEEMMIAANVCAAETLEAENSALLYRVHDTPAREKLASLREFAATLNLAFSRAEAVRPGHFNQLLAKARKAGQSEQISEMVLRSQAQAEYHAKNCGHFGLNLDRYAHFTSPIRRYADLIVHRALIAALALGDDGNAYTSPTALTEIGQHISMTERRAIAAERETSDRLLAHFLAGQLGARFAGRISGVTRSGLFVRLRETGADGFVPAATIGADYYVYVEEQQALIGERTGERYRLGDDVSVRLVEAAPVAGALRFELLSEGTRVKPPSGLQRSGTSRRPSRSHPGFRPKRRR